MTIYQNDSFYSKHLRVPSFDNMRATPMFEQSDWLPIVWLVEQQIISKILLDKWLTSISVALRIMHLSVYASSVIDVPIIAEFGLDLT